jgi:hypothetical protein
MGAAASCPPKIAQAWASLCAIQSPDTRAHMLDTLLLAPDYVAAAKRARLYGPLLQWRAAHQRGEWAEWPALHGDAAQPRLAPPAQPQHRYAPPAQPLRPPAQQPHTQQLAKAPPARRALDYLHEAYDTLGLPDDEPLTHDRLKSAYRKASLTAHPDRPGGSAEKFDALTRAFLFLQEIVTKLTPTRAGGGGGGGATTMSAFEAELAARNRRPAGGRGGGAPGTRLEDDPSHAAPDDADADAGPAVGLDPKNLNMDVFNKLFEQHRLPDPDKDDGYGEWLKGHTAEVAAAGGNAAALRGKFNADVFNSTFEAAARRQATAAAAAGSGAGGAPRCGGGGPPTRSPSRRASRRRRWAATSPRSTRPRPAPACSSRTCGTRTRRAPPWCRTPRRSGGTRAAAAASRRARGSGRSCSWRPSAPTRRRPCRRARRRRVGGRRSSAPRRQNERAACAPPAATWTPRPWPAACSGACSSRGEPRLTPPHHPPPAGFGGSKRDCPSSRIGGGSKGAGPLQAGGGEERWEVACFWKLVTSF